MTLNLSLVCLILAAAHALVAALLLGRPGPTSATLRSLPRNVPIGVVLMLLGTAWFVWNLYSSDLTDFQEWRPIMYVGFTLLGVGCCFFVQDYLFVRGAAVVALLMCDRILDLQRWHLSPWKNVVPAWCYLVICVAVWVSMSPWRVRDFMDWLTADAGRMRQWGLGLGAFAAVLGGLGLTVLR
ncbi:MAG: hypothetical protein ACKO3N_14965 [Verrucomicrobiota bacterium]